MFSGIVAGTGRVVSLLRLGPATRLTVAAPGILEGVADGESVAVNGACLTVAERPAPGQATFDLMPETLRLSNLGALVPGSVANLERSLRLGDPIGGHFVQGHLDGVAEVLAVEPEADARLVRFRLMDPALARYVVRKGFVTVDGVSLTVVEALPDGFTVSLVRTTLETTTLGSVVPGRIVNVEVDPLARHLIDRSPGTLDDLLGRMRSGKDGSERSTDEGVGTRTASERTGTDQTAGASGIPERQSQTPVEAGLAALRAGRPVLVLDEADRENEGDLVLAAQFATPEWLAFFIRECRGLVCVAMERDRLDALEIPQMVADNTSPQGTPFTVSVDAAVATTGVSAEERVATIRTLIDPTAGPSDLVRPGHVFPLRAALGGLRERGGHTEAAVELCRLAGLVPAGVIVEVMNADGTMARSPDLEAFGRTHGFPMVTTAELLDYLNEDGLAVLPSVRPAIRRLAESRVPTEHGRFRMVVYEARPGAPNDVALVLGEVDPAADPPLVRVHSECFTGDVLGSLRCDCGEQLDGAFARIAAEGRGVLVYLRQEGRGIGLANKARAYALQDAGLDTVEANLALGFPPDLRDYAPAAAILADLGIGRVRLLTNNPAKVEGLEARGIEVMERVPLEIAPNPGNAAYLATKRSRLGHLLELT